ncbi:hypothetical protein CRL705_1667 [Latilactobacillus curvatus CRL 705]|nr:hypothetical protein CRL705_1667 [Latilactobacillus curvatus CRL 705]
MGQSVPQQVRLRHEVASKHRIYQTYKPFVLLGQVRKIGMLY